MDKRNNSELRTGLNKLANPEVRNVQITKTKFVYPDKEAGFYPTIRQKPLIQFQSKVT